MTIKPIWFTTKETFIHLYPQIERARASEPDTGLVTIKARGGKPDPASKIATRLIFINRPSIYAAALEIGFTVYFSGRGSHAR